MIELIIGSEKSSPKTVAKFTILAEFLVSINNFAILDKFFFFIYSTNFIHIKILIQNLLFILVKFGVDSIKTFAFSEKFVSFWNFFTNT